jgi:hydrogenase nickel incorporation protein HypB
MNIPIIRKVLERNDAAARENRELFDSSGIFCIDLLGGAGCGKTTLLEMLLPRLASSMRIAVLEGDLETTRDAERIAALGVPAIQLLTEGGCHLTATHVRRALDQVPLESTDLLMIENVGNPICPANFELGEHCRIAVLSATEGDDKPLKYPLLFRTAAAVVISKCDLLPHVRFDPGRARAEINRINPDARVFLTSNTPNSDLDELTHWISVKTRQAHGAPMLT